MANVVASRVGETTSSTGTGDIVVSGALTNASSVVDHVRFNTRMVAGDSCEVMMIDPATGDWERFKSWYADTNILERGNLIESSTGSRISFGSGIKRVYMVGRAYANYANPTIEVLSGGTSWTVPPNVYKVKFTLIGGGGGGSLRNHSVLMGGGGGAGALVVIILDLTPGDVISYSIGGGGAGATGNAADVAGSSGGSTVLASSYTAYGGGAGLPTSSSARAAWSGSVNAYKPGERGISSQTYYSGTLSSWSQGGSTQYGLGGTIIAANILSSPEGYGGGGAGYTSFYGSTSAQSGTAGAIIVEY